MGAEGADPALDPVHARLEAGWWWSGIGSGLSLLEGRLSRAVARTWVRLWPAGRPTVSGGGPILDPVSAGLEAGSVGVASGLEPGLDRSRVRLVLGMFRFGGRPRPAIEPAELSVPSPSSSS